MLEILKQSFGQGGYASLTIALVICVIVAIAFVIFAQGGGKEVKTEGEAYVFPRNHLIIAMTLTLMTIIWGCGISYYIYHFMKYGVGEDMKVVGLGDSVLYLSSVQTQATRMYIQTRDPKWEEVYQVNAGTLDYALKQVTTTFKDKRLHRVAERVSIVHKALSKAEASAFVLVRQDKNEEARKKLVNLEYVENKLVYAENLEELSSGVRLAMQSRMDSLASVLYMAINTAIIGAAILLIAWYRALHSIRRWRIELEMSRRAAEAANAAKSDFLANMSHEIRTPMNAVLGMLAIMLDADLNKQVREWTEIARQSAESLLDIINDILDFSKIEAGQLLIEAIPFNLHNAIEGVTDLLYMRAKAKDIRLLVHFDHELPRSVIGDPLRLRQIIMNLVGNALKFTEHGHVMIRAHSQDYGEEGLLLRVEIIDTGIGIAPDKLIYVFNKFSQEQESTTRRYGGAGLGLTISKNLAKLMGGDMGVVSTVGQGSIFWFTVLLKKDRAVSESVSIPSEFSNLRVLLIEGYQPSRELVSNYFRNWEMRCDILMDSRSAIETITAAAVENDPYRFFLIDGDLPKDIWLPLIENISGMASARSLLTILCVHHGSDLPMQQLEKFHVSGILTKPLYQSQLLDMMIYLWHNRKNLSKVGVITKSTLAVDEVAPPVVKAKVPSFSGIRVLLVDDHPVNQMLMKMIVEKAGCDADLALNGVEGIDKAKANKYDVIFMDCQMPEMDGFEATRRIRQSEEGTTNHIPIIALTADAMQGDKEKCIRVGMDDYITKPVKPEKIYDMISEYTRNDDKS